jgi:ubiquinone/menaquinone biosynthesis C-methylase UbiE
MSDYKYNQVDFDNPSFFFVLEDTLKDYIGCPLFYNAYIKSFGLKGDEKILDFGCGGGTGAKCILKFLNTDGHVTCIDTSSFLMKRAEKRLKRYSNVECKLGDIRNLKIPDQSFDVIAIIHVMHDIEPAQRQAVANEISRTLKYDGSLFIREPIKKSHGMASEEIQNLFSVAGLSEVKYTRNKSEYRGKFISNEKK